MQTILVVDDSKPNIKILADLLSNQAHVLFATNGLAALEKAEQANLDLILLDVVMPGMDGYEVCKVLKRNPKTAQIPVVFITGLSDENDEEKGLDLGAIDYITKPFSAAIVRARVRNHLLARKHQRDLELATEELRAAHEREMRIAHDIQMAMLPKGGGGGDLFERCEIAAVLEPARSVGGDLYDYFLSSPGKLCFAVGDVSGKGVPAALLMVRTKTLLRGVAGEALGPDRILEAINRELCRDNDACMFVTLLVGIVDVETGELALANAGHNFPALRREDGASSFLEFEHGPALGFDETATFPEWRSVLALGDTLVLFTDGVTEEFDESDEIFSDERLLGLLPQAGPSVSELTRYVLRATHDFAGGGQSDDITVVALGLLCAEATGGGSHPDGRARRHGGALDSAEYPPSPGIASDATGAPEPVAGRMTGAPQDRPHLSPAHPHPADVGAARDREPDAASRVERPPSGRL